MNAVFHDISWLLSLDDERIEKKYEKLKQPKKFSGKILSKILDEDSRDLLEIALEGFGIAEFEDVEFVLNEIEKIVKG